MEKAPWIDFPPLLAELRRKQLELSKRRGRGAENRNRSWHTIKGNKVDKTGLGSDNLITEYSELLSPQGINGTYTYLEEVKSGNARLTKRQKRTKKRYGSRYKVRRY